MHTRTVRVGVGVGVRACVDMVVRVFVDMGVRVIVGMDVCVSMVIVDVCMSECVRERVMRARCACRGNSDRCVGGWRRIRICVSMCEISCEPEAEAQRNKVRAVGMFIDGVID